MAKMCADYLEKIWLARRLEALRRLAAKREAKLKREREETIHG